MIYFYVRVIDSGIIVDGLHGDPDASAPHAEHDRRRDHVQDL